MLGSVKSASHPPPLINSEATLMKTKVLIICVVTVQLICAFVFAYAKIGFLITWLIYIKTHQLLVVDCAIPF